MTCWLYCYIVTVPIFTLPLQTLKYFITSKLLFWHFQAISGSFLWMKGLASKISKHSGETTWSHRGMWFFTFISFIEFLFLTDYFCLCCFGAIISVSQFTKICMAMRRSFFTVAATGRYSFLEKFRSISSRLESIKYILDQRLEKISIFFSTTHFNHSMIFFKLVDKCKLNDTNLVMT